LLVGSIGQEAGDAKQRALTALATPENKNQDDCEQILVECVRKVTRRTRALGKTAFPPS
jgi:cellobiose-specific phosphotransferase system component IIA